jgi:hypothetical protein
MKREETKEKVSLMMASQSERAPFVHDVDAVPILLHAYLPRKVVINMVRIHPP